MKSPKGDKKCCDRLIEKCFPWDECFSCKSRFLGNTWTVPVLICSLVETGFLCSLWQEFPSAHVSILQWGATDCQPREVAMWKVSHTDVIWNKNQKGHKPLSAVPTNTTHFFLHLFLTVGVEVQKSSNKQAESLFLPRNLTTICQMIPIHTATMCQKHANQV